MRVEQGKLRQEVADANRRCEEKDKGLCKLMNGAKKEVAKLQSKIDMLKHDVKKWELENHRLKEKLRFKLNQGQQADVSPTRLPSAKSPLLKGKGNKLSAFVRAS